MTYNKDYQGCKPCKADSEFIKCNREQRRFKNILLECGEGAGSRTFTSGNDIPFQLAQVTVKTDCCNKDRVLIKFSSIVRVDVIEEVATARLQYELFRTCNDKEPISLGCWMYEKVDISDSDFQDVSEESFNFIFCDDFTCSDCCDYFVRVTPLEITNTTVTVSNGRIAALNQCLKDYLAEIFKSKETIIECARGNGTVIFRTENDPPVSIADVTIDTSCLVRPKTLIEFSTIISYNEDTPPAESVSLQFELFRRCDNREPLSLGVWIYDVGPITGNIQVAQGFGFNFCEYVNLSGCCEYFVILTPIEVPTDDGENAVVSNTRITAIAQSSKVSDKKHNVTDCKSKHSKFKETLLECGSGNGSRTFISPDDSDFQLAQVMIDTIGLCKPLVNIEFSGIVSYLRPDFGPDAEMLLRLQLFRVCSDRSAELKGIWVLGRLGQDTIKVTEAFNFNFCETIKCEKGCWTYFVKVTPIQLDNGTITVSNGRIAALVQEDRK